MRKLKPALTTFKNSCAKAGLKLNSGCMGIRSLGYMIPVLILREKSMKLTPGSYFKFG